MPEDDTALLTAALDHCWAWYGARTKRGSDIINYYLVATAILITAYTAAITGNDAKHYGFATVIAAAGIGLTVVAYSAARHESRAANFAVPALTELQKQIGARLDIDSINMFREHRANMGVAHPAIGIALVLAAALNLGALGYGLAQLF